MKKEASYLELEKALRPRKHLLGQAADAILDQDVSSYPIFVVHRQTAGIGIPLWEDTTGESSWAVNASTLEELATKNVINMNKVEDFRDIYKDPREYLCLLMLEDERAEFVFMPR